MVQKSQILDKYLTALEKDPKSRVFAPLAEYYRKSGLLNQAIETLNQGIKYNPDYVLGHLGLAFCYFENGDAKRSYDILRPLIDSNRDNLRMLRLFSETCLDLGKSEEALESLKYLLFVNPKDKEAAEKVKNIEESNKKFGPIKFNLQEALGEPASPAVESEGIQFNLDEMDTGIEKEKSIDEWTKVDLSNEKSKDDSLDLWSMNEKPSFDEEVVEEEVSEIEYKVERPKADRAQPSSPVITHTLVDLYCNQGYLDKAKDLLEKILELNPNDLKTKLKLQEVERVLNDSFVDESEFNEESEELSLTEDMSSSEERLDEDTEGDESAGRNNLMNLFDKKFNNFELDEPFAEAEEVVEVEKKNLLKEQKIKELKEVEAKLWSFHRALCARAKTVLSV